MKITWYGHACFAAENNGKTVIFDPYAPGSVPGVEMPAGLEADLVLCSHGHSDHNYAQGVAVKKDAAEIGLTRFACWHDDVQGAKRGNNLISVADMDGVRVAHFGDLGHDLSDEDLAALGRIDILLIPVGGFFTINALTAQRLAERIGAKLTIPMHYRGEGFGYDVIDTVDAFVALNRRVEYADTNEIDFDSLDRAQTVILRCPAEI